MNRFTLFAKKLSLLFRRNRFHSELDEEMAFHRDQVERDLRASGVSAEEAHFAAARQFGNTARIREKTHETVGFGFESLEVNAAAE